MADSFRVDDNAGPAQGLDGCGGAGRNDDVDVVELEHRMLSGHQHAWGAGDREEDSEGEDLWRQWVPLGPRQQPNARALPAGDMCTSSQLGQASVKPTARVRRNRWLAGCVKAQTAAGGGPCAGRHSASSRMRVIGPNAGWAAVKLCPGAAI